LDVLGLEELEGVEVEGKRVMEEIERDELVVNELACRFAISFISQRRFSCCSILRLLSFSLIKIDSRCHWSSGEPSRSRKRVLNISPPTAA